MHYKQSVPRAWAVLCCWPLPLNFQTVAADRGQKHRYLCVMHKSALSWGTLPLVHGAQDFIIMCKMQRLSFLAALLLPTVHHHQETGWWLWDTDGFVPASCNGVNAISFKCCLSVFFFRRRNVKFGIKEYFSSSEAFLWLIINPDI